MSVELLPCPFCGSQAYVSEDQSSDYDIHWTWHVDCTGCGATIDFKSTKEQAVNAWNSKVYEDEMSPAKHKLKNDIEQALRAYWSNNDFDVGSVEITIDSHRVRDIKTESGLRIENDINLNEFIALVANGNN